MQGEELGQSSKVSKGGNKRERALSPKMLNNMGLSQKVPKAITGRKNGSFSPGQITTEEIKK